MDLCVMIEGQEDVSWEGWTAIAKSCEENGIPALFRSDHYLSVFPNEGRQSLDAWATISGLAAITSTLRLGTMVSPASFRHPSILAKMIATADQISGGRIEPGIGAGWHQAEHDAFGFPFLPTRDRMKVLEEQLEVIRGLWGKGEFEFHGEYYDLAPVEAEPKPVQDPMPLIMGGNAAPKGAALAARFASEYNTPNPTLEEARERRAAIEGAWSAAGRDPATVRFSVMTGAALGRGGPAAEARRRLAREKGGIGADLDYKFKGSPARVVEQLAEWRDAGVDRVMIQLLLHDDLEQIEIIGRELAPALK